MRKLFEKYPFSTIVVLLLLWIILYSALQPLADAFVTLIGLPQGERLAEAVRFFVFEAPKVMLLLTLIVFAVGIMRSIFLARANEEDTRRWKNCFREHAGKFTWSSNAILFLFSNSVISWICRKRYSTWSHIFISHCRANDK